MNIEIIEIENAEGLYKNQVKIINDDGSTVTMPKSVYDEQQAALETPAVIDEATAE